MCLTRSSDGVNYMSFEELYNAPYNDSKKNLKIFHNGSWVEGKPIRLPSRDMYKVTTINNKELYVTDNHIHPTLEGDKTTVNLSTNDYLLFNNMTLNTFAEKDMKLTYEQGFLIGIYLGDGSIYESPSYNSETINFSINENKYNDSINLLNKALQQWCINVDIKLGKPYNNVYPITIHSVELKDIIRNWVYDSYCHKKELNMNCVEQSVNFRKGILDGYYLTDGGNSNRIYSTSEKLISQIECLCTTMGIHTVIDVTDRTDEKIIIRGASFNRNYPLYCIRWYDHKNKRKFKDNYIIKNNSTYFKVKSIEKITTDNEYVYCFEMNNENEPYFTLPNGIITHNCRLLSDTKKLDAFINSIGGTALSIGSIKVNTMNLMRIYYEVGNDEKKYIALLKKKTELCCKTLDVIRHIIKRNIEKGLLPNYQDGGVEIDKQYSTVGILGVYEVIEAFGYIHTDEFGNKFYTDEGVEFASKIFETINDIKDNFTNEYSLNIESVPAERAAIILCQKDNLLYEKNDKFIYSNQWIPLSEKCTINEKIRLSSILDSKCSGGSIAHINLESNFPNTEMAWKMLNYIASKGVMYFAFNTKINECKNHHGFIGTEICPNCGEPVFDTYQRIVGYLSSSRTYSKDRLKEFGSRQWYEYADISKDLT